MGWEGILLEHEHCRFKSRCPLFPRFKLQAALRVLQANYCEGSYTSCARFKLASQGQAPPPDLLPNGDHLKF